MKVISFHHGLRVFGHPLHAAVCHFPMGLLSIAVLWDFIAIASGEPWWKFGYWSIEAGLLFGCVTMASGGIDFLGIHKNAAAEKTAIIHMSFMGLAMALFCGALIYRSMVAQQEAEHVWVIVGIDLFGALFLSVGGWYGGSLVYKHRIGCADEESAPPSGES